MNLRRVIDPTDCSVVLRALRQLLGRRNRYELHGFAPGCLILAGGGGTPTPCGLYVAYIELRPFVAKYSAEICDGLHPRESFDDLSIGAWTPTY